MSISSKMRGRGALLFGAAALSVTVGLALGAASAWAQTDPYGQVVITTPRTVEKNEDGVTLQEVKMSVHVPFTDLDMQTSQGVADLNARVAKAADYVCKKLEFLYPEGGPEAFDCAKAAVRDAQPQIIKARAVIKPAPPTAQPASLTQ
jgi:UrcA family protein